MAFLLRKSARRALNALGFDIVRSPVIARLAACEDKQTIRANDAVEIEALYREFVFPEMPRRDNRAALLNNLVGTSIGEGIHVVHYLHKSMSIPGDICEFGVAQGATSRLMANEIAESERKLWLFDSFEGLPAPSPQDRLIHDIFGLGSMGAYKGTMASPETAVLEKLESIKFPKRRAVLKKGWVKETIKTGDLPQQVAFAYIDLDFYDPIKDALLFVDLIMPVGGHIIVDDYGWFSEGAQTAVDEFVASTKQRFSFRLPLSSAGHFCILSKTALE